MKVLLGFRLTRVHVEIFPHEIVQLVFQQLPTSKSVKLTIFEQDELYMHKILMHSRSLLSLLILPEGLEPLELVLIDDGPLLGLLVRLLDLCELLHELSGLLLLFLELLSYVLSSATYAE